MHMTNSKLICLIIFHNGSNFAYRYISVWNSIFSIITAILGIYLYIHWRHLGGDEKYQPPAPWSPDGCEKAEQVQSVGLQQQFLNIALILFSAIMTVSVLGILLLLFWMYIKEAMGIFSWYLRVIFPMAIIMFVLWKLVERGIRKDISRCLSGQKLKNGIPHHGVFIVVSATFLLMSGVWIAQVIYTVNTGMIDNAIAFGFCNIVTNLILTLAVWILWRIERGYSEKIYTQKPFAHGALEN